MAPFTDTVCFVDDNSANFTKLNSKLIEVVSEGIDKKALWRYQKVSNTTGLEKCAGLCTLCAVQGARYGLRKIYPEVD